MYCIHFFSLKIYFIDGIYPCDTFPLFVIWIRLFTCRFGSMEITLFFSFYLLLNQTNQFTIPNLIFFYVVSELWYWTINKYRQTQTQAHTQCLCIISFIWTPFMASRKHQCVMKYPFNSSFFHFFRMEHNILERKYDFRRTFTLILFTYYTLIFDDCYYSFDWRALYIQ